MDSTVQEILQWKMNGALTRKKLLELKEQGRPKPTLEVKQTTKDRGKDINRYFKPSMYDNADWICGCNIKNAFFCFPCLLFCTDTNNALWTRTGVTDLKHLKEKVLRHGCSVVHMSNAINLASIGRVDIKTQLSSAYRQSIQSFNETVTQNRYIISKIIDCIKFCGSFELALRGHDETELSDNPGIFRGLIDFVSELDGIFKDHLEKSTVFKEVSVQNDLLESILTVTQEKIIAEIKNARFVAIQVEETTECSNKSKLPFIVRYVLNGDIHERFWKFIEPKAVTAQALSDEILAELETLKLNETPEKLIAQCYDLASLKSGSIGGVQTRIKTIYPSAHFVYCYAHQINLILQKATSQHTEVKIFFANLHAFSSFFGKPQRTLVLNQIVKKRPPNFVPSKWDFNAKCIETVYTYKDDLIICLEKILNTEFDTTSINQAGALKGYLENDIFLYWLKMFHSIMPHVDILFSQLQKPNLDEIWHAKYIEEFNGNIKKIRENFISTEVDVKIEIEEDIKIEYGTLKRKRPEESRKSIALEICDIILSEIRCRFKFIEHLIVARLFNTNSFAKYKKDFPEIILKSVTSNYDIINVTKLKSELEVLYSREEFYDSAGAVAILQLLLEMNLGETFSESIKLLEIICTIPMMTVESDRCFSTLKRIRTFLRNTLGESRLSALAMLSIEKPFIKSISNFNELVIEHFSKQKDRRINLTYKHI